MTPAYLIAAFAEPVDPGPDKFGSGTRVILYGAPSSEAAHAWAESYARRLLLDGHPEKRLRTLEVIPVFDRVLTTEGEETIDWPSFAERADTTSQHSLERGSSMAFTPGAAAAEDLRNDDIEYLKTHIPDAKRFNWNPKKRSYYVLHNGERAFIVRAINMFLSSRPYVKSFSGAPDEKLQVFVSAFPGAEPYRRPMRRAAAGSGLTAALARWRGRLG